MCVIETVLKWVPQFNKPSLTFFTRNRNLWKHLLLWFVMHFCFWNWNIQQEKNSQHPIPAILDIYQILQWEISYYLSLGANRSLVIIRIIFDHQVKMNIAMIIVKKGGRLAVVLK